MYLLQFSISSCALYSFDIETLRNQLFSLCVIWNLFWHSEHHRIIKAYYYCHKMQKKQSLWSNYMFDGIYKTWWNNDNELQLIAGEFRLLLLLWNVNIQFWFFFWCFTTNWLGRKLTDIHFLLFYKWIHSLNRTKKHKFHEKSYQKKNATFWLESIICMLERISIIPNLNRGRWQ